MAEHDSATTSLALWPYRFGAHGAGEVALVCVNSEVVPLRAPVMPGQMSVTAATLLLKALEVSADGAITPLGWRYNLPLLEARSANDGRAGCEEPLACALAAGVALPSGMQWITLLDAIARVRYAEHVETLMRLWQTRARVNDFRQGPAPAR